MKLCTCTVALLMALSTAGVFYLPPPSTKPESGEKSKIRPALFAPGAISTDDFESHPAFTPDGKTLYFVKSNANFTHWTIFESNSVEGEWSTPRVAPFSGKYRDADPFITRDGELLYFISDRPVAGAKQGMDIWVMKRQGSGWGEPRNLGAPVNSPGDEWFPTLADNGTIYFGSDRPGGLGRTDIYRATPSGSEGNWNTPENLGPAVNSAADEFEPLIAPDERFLIFMASGRSDGVGSGDLFLTKQIKGKWSSARPLPRGINTPAMEISPKFTPDGKTFLFGSTRPRGRDNSDRAATSQKSTAPTSKYRGPGDIYQVDTAVLKLDE